MGFATKQRPAPHLDKDLEGLKHPEFVTCGPLCLHQLHTTGSRYVLDCKNCGQSNDGSWYSDKAGLAQFCLGGGGGKLAAGMHWKGRK